MYILAVPMYTNLYLNAAICILAVHCTPTFISTCCLYSAYYILITKGMQKYATVTLKLKREYDLVLAIVSLWKIDGHTEIIEVNMHYM